MTGRLLLPLLLLAGCGGVSATPLAPQDGRDAFAISCGGTFNSTLDCHRRAGEVCPAGYRVVERDIEQRDLFGGNPGIIGRIGTTRRIVITCAPRPAQPPRPL